MKKPAFYAELERVNAAHEETCPQPTRAFLLVLLALVIMDESCGHVTEHHFVELSRVVYRKRRTAGAGGVLQ